MEEQKVEQGAIKFTKEQRARVHRALEVPGQGRVGVRYAEGKPL